MSELVRALGALTEPPGPETARLASLLELPELAVAEWTQVFVLELPPFASVYLGAEGMIGGEARDRVAGFWRALGLSPPPEPDHLAALLGLYASLAETEAREAELARSALLAEHLLPWLPTYLAKLDEIAPPPFSAWGTLLAGVLSAQAGGLVSEAQAPLHLREAPALEHPGEVGPEAFLRQLLAPVRSGVIITRADLGRAARELGLGLRAGERRFALRALLEQDPAGTLGWLAALAKTEAARASGFWKERAGRAAALLASLQAAAEELEVAHAG